MGRICSSRWDYHVKGRGRSLSPDALKDGGERMGSGLVVTGCQVYGSGEPTGSCTYRSCATTDQRRPPGEKLLSWPVVSWTLT